MHQLKDHTPVPRTPAVNPIQQVPPVHPAGAVELTFASATDGVLLKVASIGASASVSGHFADSFEFWDISSTFRLSEAPLTMTYLEVAEIHNVNLDSFFSDLSPAFSASGNVTGILWSTDVYAPPPGAIAYLFTAQDPDDSAKKIGLALTLDSAGVLTDAVWYKTSTKDGYSGSIWQAGNVASNSILEWTFVASGDASDPPKPPSLPSGKAWYYLAEGLTLTSSGRARRSPTPAR